MSGAQKSFISSTYWTERTGPAAALAFLEKAEKTRVWEHAAKIGTLVSTAWKKTAEKYALPLTVHSEEDFSCLAAFGFDGERANELRTLFTRKMLEKGFLATTGFYPTLAHTEKEIHCYIDALDQTFACLREALDSPVPVLAPEEIALSGFQRLVR